jgi:hypothetical protein
MTTASFTSTTAIPAVSMFMTAPIQATVGSDSTGTKSTSASPTEFTGIAPVVVAGEVGVLAIIVAFLLA